MILSTWYEWYDESMTLVPPRGGDTQYIAVHEYGLGISYSVIN
jgi:hypothetical protein